MMTSGTGSKRPPTAPQTQRRISVNPFAAVLQDDDDDATPKHVDPMTFNNGSLAVNNNAEENDKDDDEDDCSQTSQSSSNHRVRPPRPSMAIRASKMSQQQRRRRRSSARFLQLTKATRDGNNIGDEEDDDDDDVGHRSSTTTQNGTLQEMYQTAIRMNAENKINTTNSWNLHIIDQMDALLSLNDGIEAPSRPSSKASTQTMNDINASTNGSETSSNRVNFTKASCTLDASVKIYSYRVDDVHLTSYKVLANLNRTQNNKNDKTTTHSTDGNQNNDDDDEEATHEKSQRKESNKASFGSTLETNIANINLNKLDSAYDIDPLFHKMSKTFDEGGAKGLLLANLGVSETSCRIIFDSSANDVEYAERKFPSNSPRLDPEHVTTQEESYRIAEGMMDISSLTEKLKSLLSEFCDDDEWDIDHCNTYTSSVRSVPLVPQLSSLRSEHEKLVVLGCCGPDAATALASTIGPKTPAGKVRKYHANSEQEQDADFSIHKEAIERSHRKLNFSSDDVNASSPNALFPNDGTDHHNKAFTPTTDTPMCDDYGGGYGFDDGVDDDDDHCFDAFIANARYSEVSLVSVTGQTGTTTTALDTMMQPLPSTFVANFIDAISSGTTVLSNNDYEYFSSKGGKSNNEWAGAAHWKRDNGNKRNDAKTKTKGKISRKKTAKSKKRDLNGETLVAFDPSVAPDLTHFLRPTTKRKGSNTSSSTLLTKAMIAKYTDEENVLPHDVGFHSDSRHSTILFHLTKLFLCPNVSILQPLDQNQMRSRKYDVNGSVEPKKMVEFNLPSSADWNDNDDEGPAYDFGGDDNNDDDEFVVPLLENIRKVDKVRVGYATVAKKVDVKRLKRDLWSELESRFISATREKNSDIYSDTSENETRHSPSNSNIDIESTSVETAVVSFQETVRILGLEQSQTDITLPFYFICILHLANEKGLRLEQKCSVDDEENTDAQYRLLSDFAIYRDELLTSDIY